ncbi:hypothetical protein [Coxiella-like endosymbiont]|uniref:hypothetical protein n=1 Tax=Coxiella-like endosymbiont TaxID=1592897 RepID=UPI00272C58B2|nr:hypothetical protein [Coxiella-like endosymbiont]
MRLSTSLLMLAFSGSVAVAYAKTVSVNLNRIAKTNQESSVGSVLLTVEKNGTAKLPILALRLKVQEVMDHSLIIHVDGDNYSDYPEKLGDGSARIACEVKSVIVLWKSAFAKRYPLGR